MKRVPVLSFALLGAVWAPSAFAQTPDEIVGRMLDAFERNTASVDNYVVVQEVMGFRSELYFEKETVDGRAVFRLRAPEAGGMGPEMDEDLGYTDIFAAGPQLAAHARYGGTERVGDEEVHVLLFDDLSALDLGPSSPSENADFRPRHGRILVDSDQWVPLRMEFVGDLDMGQGSAEVTSVIDLEDYRDEDGLLLPYRTVVRMEGLGAAIDPEARSQLEEMRRQLAELPESQRALVEEMFRGQMEQMEALLDEENGRMTVEVVVLEVRVNEGPGR
jgi:hypothetical protein